MISRIPACDRNHCSDPARSSRPGMKKSIAKAIVNVPMGSSQLPCACTAAGSDPSGGAGIQADLKTFASLGVWGLSVVTAVTSQNPGTVRGIWPVPPDVVRMQFQALFEDFTIPAIKTGMLPDGDVVRAVADSVPENTSLVVDPVMVATSGCRLMQPGAVEELKETLIPRATVVTPNLAEAEVLACMGDITTLEGMRKAGGRILELGCRYVVMKGGHLPGPDATDILLGDGREWVFPGPRTHPGAHGSGCCFSAAITACLSLGHPVPNAVGVAKEFVGRAIGASVKDRCGIYMVNASINGNDRGDRGRL
jgi:hydroxymethylpyrimidine/phosphomethylpyrimidine kinase